MLLEQYVSRANKTNTIFSFFSEGEKGKVLKRVQYAEMGIDGVTNLYNLAFGDSHENSDEIDDLSVTDNQDRDKVLATVVNTVYIFTENYPEASIFLTGSTPVRTRLYQMAINKYFDEFSKTFEIKGLNENGISNFEKNTKYQAFLITRK